MGIVPLNSIDPVVGSATAAVVFETLSQCIPSGRLELYSEMICWGVLSILLKYSGASNYKGHSLLPTDPQKQRHSSLPLWLVAAGITGAAFYRTESNAIGFYPILTPLLLTVHKYSQSLPSEPLSALINTIWGAALIAVPSVFSLSNGDLIGSLISLVLVVFLLFVYSIFSPEVKIRVLSLPAIDLDATVKAIAVRVYILLFATLVFQAFVLGPPARDSLVVFFTGFLKALSWFFTIQTTRHTSWNIATTLGTFALACTRNPFSQTSQLYAVSHIAVSILALYQTTQLLPKQAKGKILLWCCLSISIVPFVYNEYMIYDAQSSALNTFADSQPHPIEALAQEANKTFGGLLKKQSQSSADAAKEYRRRYGIDPPEGFSKWFHFAKAHESPILDEFDTIHKSIAPFLKLSGKEYSEMIAKVYKTPQSEVWLCEFTGKTANTICRHPSRSYDRHYSFLFNKLLWNLPGSAPNVKFLINHFDEPRVMLPTEKHMAVKLNDKSFRPTWDELTRSCATPAHKTYRDGISDVETFGLPFVKDHSSDSDLCNHPEYKDIYGAFISPKTFQIIQSLAPVLSTGKFSAMGDIIFPSPAYIEEEFQYDESHDIPWSQKKNNLYWTGSTTGGYALDDQWKNHQRQRFVNLAQNLRHQEHSYLRKKDGVISTVKSWFLNGRLYDVGFTRIFQCDRKFCRDQSTHFNVKSWAHRDAALRSKLAFDLDGNGISGRYYKLLASNSVPLKQTLLREWHDERLMPWVHYIPVSESLKELPELVTYLTSTEAGQKLAEGIAKQGSDWMKKAVREVDMTIYTYRLLLELARLQDPTRKAI
ncbi:hypothetical protein F53441_12666 [Fusarium austroafricanum]|uniref:Glycosyl transferase CAP10 domain-containing protein n=1 Tax=Fusarium austroafricanum TaxID=2364996 RepID=A0A8H4JVH9_9HYPO|nr:hypothetical protein F53441_12666 [Fusarium austroafricanum]